MNIEMICKETCNIAREAGEYIRGESLKFSTGDIETKGKHDYVSYVDKNTEKKIINNLQKLIPGTGFIAEEGTYKQEKKYNWIIDPLDGTTNFIHGLPPYSVSIALMDNQEIILGVVYEIGLDECFFTRKDCPAYLNGKEINVSKTGKVNDSLLATGFPFSNFDRFDQFIDSLRYFMRNSHGVRRLGSAAVDLAYTACGRFDAFWEYNLNPWDIAAGIIILKNAGGKVSDFSGGNKYLSGKEIVAGNPYLFEEFLEHVRKFMSE
ncbi:MAG: inositol monophosphatase [Bacteroidales bacterium]|nr:inositol monophosphatase [Bacteroidales bacterium]